MELLVADRLDSPAHPPTATRSRPPFRVAAVQMRFDPDPHRHRTSLAAGVELAASAGARLVCLPELTLSPYFAVDLPDPASPRHPEPLPGGPTFVFATELATRHHVFVHASLYERPAPSDPPGVRGYNTAICVSPDGSLLARTRKLHLPSTAGYREDTWFAPGDTGFPVADLDGLAVGFPTCFDQWFPELARAYALAGADLLVFPTAIGSEPDFPGFDTEPLWEQVICANAITNGLFSLAVNRTGIEGPLSFYGSSFIADPYGRVLVQAPRDEPAVIIADLDLDQARDWLELFPFFSTRRPDTYSPLTAPRSSR